MKVLSLPCKRIDLCVVLKVAAPRKNNVLTWHFLSKYINIKIKCSFFINQPWTRRRHVSHSHKRVLSSREKLRRERRLPSQATNFQDIIFCKSFLKGIQSTLKRDATTSFPAKWRQRNERRNSILMMCHYQDLSSTSDRLKQISLVARPIRSTTQIWVVTRHQNGISVLIPQTSFRGETSGGLAKYQLFSQALIGLATT